MDKEKLKLKDESGDRKYFTQIPNMIVNHSTAYEQSLYLVMKRLAGEHGSCFASLNFLAQKMGVNRKTVSSNIEKLLQRKWIMEINPVKVRGGSVRQFKIADLWMLNMREYESGSKKDRVEVGSLFPEVGLQRNESGTGTDTKKNIKNNYIKKNVASEVATVYPSLLDELLESKRRVLQIIGVWVQENKIDLPNKEVRESIIKRNLRPAKLLEGYTNENMIDTIRVLKNTDYLKKFTMETCLKYIDEVASQKKKQGPKIIRFEEVIKPNGEKAMRPIYEKTKMGNQS